ncbi:MAG: tyrosine-type recombinase/integrase, partial [Rhodospirillales bacterium]|nr:tyrosine-type recombinase/integrase [Rhodospirillales bacterium]
MKLSDACDAFLEDCRARNLSASAFGNYKGVLGQLLDFANTRGISEISEIDVAALRSWRASWGIKPATHQLRLAQLKRLFGFAVNEGWIAESPAEPLKAPKNDAAPTMPLAREEIRAMFAAAGGATRERALLMLMRYSGLAIRDASTLRCDALDGAELTMRRAKSGELVMCTLPAQVADELESCGRDRPHFFWTGSFKSGTVANYWRQRLAQIADKAGVQDFRTHRLRDTFAVELLLADVSIEDVSVLLGHSSVQTTERYYAPWDPSR